MRRGVRTAGIVIVTLVALSVVVYSVQRHVDKQYQRPGLKFLGVARSAVWSADGQAIYYEHNEDEKLWRYDLASGRKQPVKNFKYGISPDGQYKLADVLVETGKNEFGTTDAFFLTITDLKTGKESRIYKAKGLMEPIDWLSSDLIVLTDVDAGDYKTLILNRNGMIATLMPKTKVEIASVVAKGFVYTRLDGTGSFYYSLATKKSRRLPTDVDEANQYFYLSSNQLVYARYGMIKSVSFKTMTIHKLHWVSDGSAMRISPLLNKYWIAYWPIGEWNQPDLQLGDTPAYALKIMREIEASGVQKGKADSSLRSE